MTMALETGFAWASRLALLGWLLLLTGLLLQGAAHPSERVKQVSTWALWTGGRLLPAVLGAGYAWAILTWFAASDGGYESLETVARLFESRGLLLAGWLHFLAFDLWVGRWQVDRLSAELGTDTGSRAAWLIRLAVLPCLLATFMFGPIGLLLFLLLLRARQWAARLPHVRL